MRGAQIIDHSGVLGYVVMIDNFQQRSRWRVFTTPSTNGNSTKKAQDFFSAFKVELYCIILIQVVKL